MREDIAGVGSESSRPTWEELEGWVRERAQEFIQGILEEEVTELLGREKSERRRAVDAVAGYRNGYGKPSGPRLIGTRVCGLSRPGGRRRTASTGSRCVVVHWRFWTGHGRW